MILADDPAGFVDRQLFDFPPERDMYLKELKVPVPNDIPDIESILRVRELVHFVYLHTNSHKVALTLAYNL